MVCKMLSSNKTTKLDLKYLITIPALLTAIYWGMVKLCLPIVPHLSEHFNISHSSIQQIFSCAFLLGGISPVFWGPVVDNIGIKKFISIIGIIFIATSASIPFLTKAYFFGIFFITSCTIGSAFIVIARSFPMMYGISEKYKKIAISSSIFGGYFSAWIAPFISGYLAVLLSWKLSFYIMPIIMIICVLMIRFINEPSTSKDKRVLIKSITSMYQIIKISSFNRPLMLLAAFAAFGQSMVISIPFLLINTYHIKSHMVALILLPMLLPGMLTIVVNKCSSIFKTKTILYFNIVFFNIAALILIILPCIGKISIWYWVIPGTIINLSTTIVYPILSIFAFKEIKTHHNSAAALIGLSTYSCAGILIFICSYIISCFYVYGLIMFLTGLMIIKLAKNILINVGNKRL